VSRTLVRRCRHCGDPVPYDAPSPVCGRCACLPVAERGRQPGDDDDRRMPSRCVHCLAVGQGNPCPACAALIADIESADEPAPRPAPETEEARRERFHAARVASVRASFERGRRCLLARALDPADQSWAAPQPR
jgi:hypothetical protein